MGIVSTSSALIDSAFVDVRCVTRSTVQRLRVDALREGECSSDTTRISNSARKVSRAVGVKAAERTGWCGAADNHIDFDLDLDASSD